MTRVYPGLVIIEDEYNDDVCEMCGTVDDLRPYGPNHPIEDRPMNVCFSCGMKDSKLAQQRFYDRVDAAMIGISDSLE